MAKEILENKQKAEIYWKRVEMKQKKIMQGRIKVRANKMSKTS